MSHDLVSVIIAAFNAEQFIGRTLASAQGQTYPNLEIIVVDDGSTDDTAKLIEDAARRDRRLRLLRQENRGVAAARNRGAVESGGAMVAPLDADDLWHPRKIERQVEELAAGGERVGLVYTWSLLIDADDFILDRGNLTATKSGNVQQSLLLGNFIGNASTPLIRRKYFEQVGGYNEELRYCEDFDLYLRLSEICDFRALCEPLTAYRQTAFSMSQRTDEMVYYYRRILADVVERRRNVAGQTVRRSVADFLLYAAKKRFSAGDGAGAFGLFLDALRLDPLLPTRQEFRRVAFAAVRRATLRREDRRRAAKWDEHVLP
jgi:glycosyltransferase involved in cell wall biosynthesis